MKSLDKEKRMRRLSKYYDSLLIIVVLVVTYLFIHPFFETNDDTGILFRVAGYMTGTPSENTVITSVIWGKFLSLLYSIFPKITWYAFFYFVLTYLSLISFCKFSRLVLGRLYGYCFSFVVYITTQLYFAVAWQFTTLAVFCGMAAVSIYLMIALGLTEKGGGILAFLFFSLCCYVIRPKVAVLTLAVLIVSLIVIFFIFFRLNMEIRFFVYTIIFGKIVDKLYTYINGWGTYELWRVARGKWTDYPRVLYVASPNLYLQIGWTENLYNLVSNWFFMDDRVTTENFNYLSSYFQNNFSGGLISKLKIGIAIFMYHYAPLIFTILILSLFFVAVCCIVSRMYKLLILWILVWILEVFVITFFIIRGRIPIRVSGGIIVLFIPMVLLFIYSIKRYSGYVFNKTRYRISFFVMAIGIVVFSFSSPYGMANTIYKRAIGIDQLETTRLEMEKYAIAHRENLLIHDSTLAIAGSPFTSYPNEKPYNLMFWGGTIYSSPIYYEQLSMNGYQQLDSSNFFDERILFMGATEVNPLLNAYMLELYPECTYEIVDIQDRFVVWRYVKK